MQMSFLYNRKKHVAPLITTIKVQAQAKSALKKQIQENNANCVEV